MKQKLLLKAMLLLCALIAGSSSVWAASYVKVTSANDLVSGDVYVIAEISDNTTKYLVTGYNSKLAYTTSGFSVSDNTITTSTATPLEFTLGTVTSGNNTYYTLKYSSTNYLIYNSSTNFGNATSTDADNARWSISPSTSAYRITNVGTTTRYIGRNGSNIGAYDTGNSYPNCYLFKKQASGKTETSLGWSAASAEVYKGDTPSLPTLSTISPAAISMGITYNSTNTSVATINASGVVTIVNPGTTTIQAIYEEDATYEGAVASYTLNVYGVYTTTSSISAMQTATASAPYNTSTGSKARIKLYNALVTYVNGNSAYIIDEDGYGALIFQNGHGFTAGKIINGNNLEVTLCLFGGATEIKGVKSTGVTTENGTVNAQTKTIGAVSVANQSMMVKFENVIYNSATSSFTDNTNSIVYVDKFSVSPTLSDGGKYDVTGLLIMDNGTLKVAPIAAGGIVSKLVNPTSQWKNGEVALTSITINKAAGNTSFTFETNSDGAVTYTSTNTTVATIAANGTITPVGYGTTTIKANTAATSNYNADEQSFTLKVGDASVDVIQVENITFESGTGYKNWTNVSGLTTTATYAGQSNTGVTYIQIRKQNPAGIVSTTSAGRVKKVYVEWAGTNTNNRTLTIYGKNTPYSSGADLYGDGKGTSLGTIKFTTGAKSGELEIDDKDNYGYIGIYADGAAYFSVLAIGWDEDVRCVETSQYEWATAVCDKALDFTGSTVKAYIVTGHNGTALEKTAITATVPANTPLLINADKGSYAVPVTASSSTDVSANLLQPGTGAAISAVANKTRYVLSVNNNNTPDNASDDFAEFQKIVSTAATVPVGKAYLEFDGDISAPSLSFDYGDANGINTVNVERETLNGEVYNLAGQRVANPTKGLYIVNGKKVIVK